MPKLLFIIGMQKSGTSLLNRMLMQQNIVNNPFLPEGKFFWGDNPPFSPIEKPCGELYQMNQGVNGHHLGTEDYRNEDKILLLDRIKKAAVAEPILMNKNPYNSVRISWLKKVFPDSIIVAMVRDPVANVYSLLKKYHESNKQVVGPENGWWGIKPKSWQTLKSDNKINQSALQWFHVNKEISDNLNLVNMIVNYESLCDHPNKILQHIFSHCGFSEKINNLPQCKSQNDEYKLGSRLLSKNQEFRTGSGFDLTNIKEQIEIQPLKIEEIYQIQSHCLDLWETINHSDKLE